MNMEEHNGCCSSAGEGRCGNMIMGKMCHGHLLKKVVMVVVMIFMFWFGLQLGELRTLTKMQEMREYGSNYGYRMMGFGENRGGWAIDSQQGIAQPQAVIGIQEKAAVTTPTNQ